MKPQERNHDSAPSWSSRVAALAPESSQAFLFALRITGSQALAEEAVQDAYARLLQYPLKDQGHSQAVVYLFKTVRSTALNHCRSARNRRLREDEYAVRLREPSSPEEQAQTSELGRAARAELAQLPQEEREAVSLCCEQEMPRRTAAEILDIPETTLIDRMQRGLEKLRVRLTAQGFASVTPVLVGEGLRNLGIPRAPSALLQSVGELTRGAARKSIAAGGKAVAAKAAAGAGSKVLAGIVLVTVVTAAAVVVPSAKRSTLTPPASKALRPAAQSLAHFDFEDGRSLSDWEGAIEPGPARPGNHACLAGKFMSDANVSLAIVGENEHGLFTYRPGAVMDFDYWVDDNVSNVSVYVWDRTEFESMGGFEIQSPVKNRWAHATVDLSTLTAKGNKRIRASDLIVNLTVRSEGRGKLYIDNIDINVPQTK